MTAKISFGKFFISIGLYVAGREREVALPNRQGHTCAPWVASGRGQLGCWAESHHRGV